MHNANKLFIINLLINLFSLSLIDWSTPSPPPTAAITCAPLAVLSVMQQKFDIEPIDRTVKIGGTVLLPCRVVNKVGMLQWTRDGFGLGSDRPLAGFPRYQMIGSDEEGDFSLQINGVTLEDDAVFQCQVGAANGVRGIRSRSSKLTVHIPPEGPKILQGNHVQTTSGLTLELTCESHAGKPPAEVRSSLIFILLIIVFFSLLRETTTTNNSNYFVHLFRAFFFEDKFFFHKLSHSIVFVEENLFSLLDSLSQLIYYSLYFSLFHHHPT